MHLFLDSNALVKLYHAEAGTENLLYLLNENANDLILTISYISKIEFHSAFLKRVQRKSSLKLLKKHFPVLKTTYSCST